MITKDKINFTEDQLYALKLLQSWQNVHLYGEAGTGKSFVLKMFLQTLSDAEMSQTIVAAPTGIAAINVEGATLHRIFRIPIGLIEPDKKIKLTPAVKAASRIIIDEYSMMRFDVFDYVVRTIKEAEIKAKHRIQIIVVGDALQLPPVITQDEIEHLYELWQDIVPHIGSGFPFNHPLWNQLNFVNCHLTEVIRQNGDRELIENENMARYGDAKCLKWFAENTAKTMLNDAIHICPTNREAKAINDIKTRPFKDKVLFQMTIQGKVNENEKVVDEILKLAPGMRVMSMVNCENLNYYQNGSLGTIVKVDAKEVVVTVNFDNGHQCEITPHTWEIYNYEISSVDGKSLEKTVIGTYTQIPLRIAYAITIHKSQGQTYDKVIIHPNCFTEGQLYVALSRCKTRQGMYILGKLSSRCLLTAMDALKFYERIST